MGSVPSELSFDSRALSAKTMTDILQSSSPAAIGDSPEKKADSLLSKLQEEVKKIDPFQNQLPLSMLLLNDAIIAVKEWIECLASEKNQAPVLEEFIPLKKSEEEEEGEEVKEEKDSSKDKRNWMSSVQLWSSDDCVDTKQSLRLESKVLPKEEDLGVSDLSLLTPGTKKFGEEFAGSTGSRATSSSRGSDSQSDSLKGPSLQGSRKQRRCWSPELHRRFVSALQQLGGSQAATPKQIREIMQVDGLTNDEVKSHLQKYRLHTRRTTPSGNTLPTNQSLVVLGGLWMSQEESSKAGSSQSNSPQGPLQFGIEDDNEDDAKSESYSWKCHAQVGV
ncbi:Myb family transcription factor EFM [Linum perenne]